MAKATAAAFHTRILRVFNIFMIPVQHSLQMVITLLVILSRFALTLHYSSANCANHRSGIVFLEHHDADFFCTGVSNRHGANDNRVAVNDGVAQKGASKTGGVSKISDFPASNVNISKTVADTAKVTISD